MARGEVWNETNTLFRIGRIKVVEAGLFVAQDDTNPLPAAFQMLVSIRILGAVIDGDITTNNFAVKNGNVSIPIAVATFDGNLDGSVANWEGITGDGSASSDPEWADAEHVQFALAALGKVTIPLADVLAFVPGVGFFLKALLSAIPGKQVSFTLGTIAVAIPVHRVDGTAVLPPNAVVPAWWP